MPEEFFVPKLGQTVEEVIMVGWLVEDGAKVSQGEAVMEVETDKAVFPVEANAKGYIHLGPYKAGDMIPVLTVVAIIGKQDDKFEAGGSSAPAAPQADSAPEQKATPVVSPNAESTAAGESDRVFVSPRAKKLAAETSVDVTQVTPSGYDGVRVTERDVRDYLSPASQSHARCPTHGGRCRRGFARSGWQRTRWSHCQAGCDSRRPTSSLPFSLCPLRM